LTAAISRASQVSDVPPPAELVELLLVDALPPLPAVAELPVEPPAVDAPVVEPLTPTITEPVQPARTAPAKIIGGPEEPMRVKKAMLRTWQRSCRSVGPRASQAPTVGGLFCG
jgi:hypothetical protein